jgi:hypothetical protein
MCRSTAPPSADPPPMPYFAMKSKARSEPLWSGCQHSTAWRADAGARRPKLSE